MKTALGAVIAVLFASCGGSVTTTLPTPCGTYAEAYCAKEESCTNGVSITRNWGDMATCLTRETLVCTDALGAPRTGQTTALIEQCTSSLPTSTCDDLLSNKLGATCNPLGPGASGAVCAFNAQCASGFCSNVRYGTCGTCTAPPAAESSCALSNCAHDQACVWTVGVVNVCEPYVSTGSACGPHGNPLCSPVLSCAGSSSTTGADGICQPGVATVGAPCGSKNMGLNCDNTTGLWCIDDACVQVTYAGDGMPCGYVGSGLVECTAGTCYSSAGPYFSYAGPQTGVCKAFAPDGAPCNTEQGPECMSPARCVTKGSAATAGVCTAPTASVSETCG